MARRGAGFVLFGIPVTIDPFFLIGILLLSAASGSGTTAIATGVAIGLFTLIHELGHALMARRFGAHSTITLSFLMGWASYSGRVRLSGFQRTMISLAGPMAQLGSAVVTLFVLRQWTDSGSLSIDTADALWTAVMWAGVLLAFLNLLPMWPLDGGHIVETVASKAFGRDLQPTVQRFTLGVCVGALVLSFVHASSSIGFLDRSEFSLAKGSAVLFEQSVIGSVLDTLRGMPWVLVNSWFILLFCGLSSWRSVRPAKVGTWVNVELNQANDRGRRSGPPKTIDAERQGWLGAGDELFPKGWGPSPWLQAHRCLVAGAVPEAQQWLSTVTQDGRWVPPPADEPLLAPLVAIAPPLQPGALRPTLWAMEIISRHGDAHRVATDGLAVYQQLGNPEALYLVAAGLARLGMGDEAMAWLRRAVAEQPDADRISAGPEFRPLHNRFDFQQLLAQLRQVRTRR